MPHSPFDASTPKAEITIQGLEFAVFTPYREGDTLSANEALALNQTRLENLRNNFASVIKKHVTDTIKAAAEAGQELKAEDVPLDVSMFADDLAQRDASYEFGARRVGAGPALSPVEKEARKIAREKITEALSAQGHKVKDLPEGWMDAKIAEVSQAESIQKEAQRRINSIGKIALDELDLSAPTAEAA